MKHLVVMETFVGGAGREPLWAWATVVDGRPGFEDVSFTRADGVTPVDAPEPMPRLGKVLFTTVADLGEPS